VVEYVRHGLPVSRQSPIQVVTVPGVEQLRWSRPICYRYTTQPCVIHAKCSVLWTTSTSRQQCTFQILQ